LIGANNPDDIYCRLCAKAAKKGQTMFLGRIPHESPMLASAYAAAKVHAQVSWFETPGLSSLEAALAGCNIVVSDRGCTRDYFKNYAWYCDPADIDSICHAISEAYYSPKRHDLKLHMLNYTWDKVAKKTWDAYHRILNSLYLVSTSNRSHGRMKEV
jgi:glycosyltransferase involved in cell wall biosynthesis